MVWGKRRVGAGPCPEGQAGLSSGDWSWRMTLSGHYPTLDSVSEPRVGAATGPSRISPEPTERSPEGQGRAEDSLFHPPQASESCGHPRWVCLDPFDFSIVRVSLGVAGWGDSYAGEQSQNHYPKDTIYPFIFWEGMTGTLTISFFNLILFFVH